MTLLRMIAFRPAGESSAARAPAAPPGGRAAASTAAGGSAPGAHSPAGASPADAVSAADSGPWATIVSALELSGAARQLASHCVFVRPPGRSRALRRRCAQPAGAYAGAGREARTGAVALLRRAGAARVSGRGCARRDSGASRTARLRAGAGCRAACIRGRPGACRACASASARPCCPTACVR